MRHSPHARLRTSRRAVLAIGLSLGLIAAACSERSDDVTVDGDDDETEEPAATAAEDDDPSDGTDPDEEPTTTDEEPTATDGDDPEDDMSSEPVYGGSISVGGEAEVGEPWTPANVRCESNCYQRALTFYDTLVVIDENYDWQPFLAETIEPNDDYTEWTVKLREGITFHDGEPLNAEAAIYNLNEHATSILTAAALADLARDPDDETKFALEQVDEYTFTIFTGRDGDINDPVSLPRFPYGLTRQAGFMASPAWLEAVKGDPGLAADAVGTGPFMIQSYQPDDRMLVVRNEDYWLTDDQGNQLPYLDEIEFVVIPDSQTRQAALESGDIDVLATSDGRSVGELLANDSLVTVQQSDFTETAHILLHVGKPDSPLNSQEVRCALVQGLDRDELLAQQTNNVFQRADDLFSDGQEGHLDDAGLPEYDPAAAREAIEAYEAEHGPVEIIYSTTAVTINERQAQFVQQQWEAIGVDVDINTVLQAELITNAALGSEMFDAFGWRNHGGLYVDQQLYWWHSRNADTEPIALNFGRMRDDVLDENLEIARSTTDDDERREAAEAINRRMSEQCYHIPTWRVEWGVSRTPEVAGVGDLHVPDTDVTIADGAGFPGQVWLTTVYLDR